MSAIRIKREAPFYRFQRAERAAAQREQRAARAAAAAALSEQSRAALARVSVSAGLTEHRQRTAAAALLADQRAEREAEREALSAAEADAAAERAALPTDALAAGLTTDPGVLAARRRDSYRAALSYPLTGAELLALCESAADAATQHSAASGDVDRQETIGWLVAYVVRRHGPQPLRCDVGEGWLRAAAARFHAREQYQRERATGMRASAAALAAWSAATAADSDGSDDADGSGPDTLWRMAAGMERLPFVSASASGSDPAVIARNRPLTAGQWRERLALSAKQTAALAHSLASAQRVTVAMTGAERKAANDARAILRKRYPDVPALRLALHPERVYAAAVSAAQRIARKRAAIGGYGSHLPGQRDSGGTARLACKRPAPAAPQSPAIIGPQRFTRHGNGYSGACSIRPELTRWAAAHGLPAPALPAHQDSEQRSAGSVRILPLRPAPAAVIAPPLRQRQRPGIALPVWAAQHRAAARVAGLAAMNAKAQRRDPLWQHGSTARTA